MQAEKGIATPLVIITFIIIILITFIFAARPFKTAENAVSPLKGGEIVIAEQISYKFIEPEIGDRVLFIPNDRGGNDYIGIITNINEEGNVKTYNIVSTGTGQPWIVSEDKIIWKIYYPFVSQEDLDKVINTKSDSSSKQSFENSNDRNTNISYVKKCQNEYSNTKLGFSFKCPEAFEFEITSADGNPDNQNSYILHRSKDQPTGPGGSSIYISIIPQGFESGGGEIYNYNTQELKKLLSMQIGESKAVRNMDDPQMARFWTYARIGDEIVGGLQAKVFENKNVWESSERMEEKRLYIEKGEHIYMIGAYLGKDVSAQQFDEFISGFKFIDE